MNNIKLEANGGISPDYEEIQYIFPSYASGNDGFL